MLLGVGARATAALSLSSSSPSSSSSDSCSSRRPVTCRAGGVPIPPKGLVKEASAAMAAKQTPPYKPKKGANVVMDDEALCNGLKTVDNDWYAMLTEMSARVWDEGGLVDPTVKVLITVALDIKNGVVGQPFEPHVRMALRRGISFAQLRELCLMVSMYAGINRTPAAYAELKRIEASIKDPPPTPELPGVSGNVVKDDEGLCAGLATVDAEWFRMLSMMADHVWPENSLLEPTMKEWVTLAFDIQNGVVGQPFEPHVRMLVRRGVNFAQIREVVLMCAMYMGVNRTPAAYAELKRIEAAVCAGK
eukprot:jgi/Chlat1/5220/Chrsp33S05184